MALPLALGPYGCSHTWLELRAGLSMADLATTLYQPMLLPNFIPN